jgi:hypothetical protein
MKQLRTITITEWELDEPSTGLEYKVKYSPEDGVDEVISICAVEIGGPPIITSMLIFSWNQI